VATPSTLVAQVLVVLDEAYIEFSGQPSRLGWPARHDNLVVLRTFSKSAGLAGEDAASCRGVDAHC
jgi:histidinol-phosphate/aromatic aminotransferase/cobyric acid decarboxylase-like protein